MASARKMINGQNTLYVVMCQFNRGEWGIADFWDMPYVSTRRNTAVQMKRNIERMQARYHWRNKESR